METTQLTNCAFIRIGNNTITKHLMKYSLPSMKYYCIFIIINVLNYIHIQINLILNYVHIQTIHIQLVPFQSTLVLEILTLFLNQQISLIFDGGADAVIKTLAISNVYFILLLSIYINVLMVAMTFVCIDYI